MNIRRAQQLVANLFAQGVREFCICAGSRNSPLVVVLEQTAAILCYAFFEERSAAFFALGRIKLTGQPVAVVTTSGTAAAELLPATIEAHYSGLPLVLVTADRPPEYRGTGSPQTIEQIGLYSHYVGAAFDFSGEVDAHLRLPRRRPTHVNICFDEPLLDEPVTPLILSSTKLAASVDEKPDLHFVAEQFKSMCCPLVMLGRISVSQRSAVEQALVQLGAPIWAEAPSGLRESQALAHLILRSGENLLKTAWTREFDGVIRIGSVPTVRFWRDLEKLSIPVLSLSEEPFAGLSRGTLLHLTDLASAMEVITTRPLERDLTARLLAFDRSQATRWQQILAQEPHSELGWFQWLSQNIHSQSHVFLGNSLPIREWDLAATYESRQFRVEVNRGANGIDGQLSTFWGAASPTQDNWGIFGDLTTLYDLSAPWILSQLEPMMWRLVVINNFGGQIFSRLFKSPNFINAHRFEFAHWAEMWKLPYEKWCEPGAGPAAAGTVLEIQPDAASTARCWQAYGDLWRDR
jgi:2-succinyl-5-enolpyruvyl-6-hydroxy-3-cyclohexene-1-carboxylate synthase